MHIIRDNKTIKLVIAEKNGLDVSVDFTVSQALHLVMDLNTAIDEIYPPPVTGEDVISRGDVGVVEYTINHVERSARDGCRTLYTSEYMRNTLHKLERMVRANGRKV